MERFGPIDPQEIGEKVQGMAGNVQEKVKDVIKNVSSEVQGRVEAARERIEELRDKDASEIMDEVGSVVRDHPLATIGACLFLGYTLGRLLGGRS